MKKKTMGCFWCVKGREKILASGGTNTNAFTYAPCPACKKMWDEGIVLLEVLNQSNWLPPIDNNAWPTGRWVVVSETVAKKLFKPKKILDIVLKNRKAFVDSQVWARQGLPI